MIVNLLNFIKSKLGSSSVKLELSDDDIVTILQQETLKTISVYNPFYVEYMLNMDTDLVEGSNNTFYIPDNIYGFIPFGVEKVINASSFTSYNQWGVLGGDLRTAMELVINSKMINNLEVLTLPPQTFQYIQPNIIRLNTSFLPSLSRILLVLRTTHKDDFSTIPFGLRETVKNLAMSDVCSDLLGMRTYFQNLTTPFAEINLNVDYLRDWVDKRNDIIDSLRKNQLKNANAKKIFFA
jgi:hypothetical protein